MPQGLIDVLVTDLKRGRHQLEALEAEIKGSDSVIDLVVFESEWILLNVRYFISWVLLSVLTTLSQ